MRFVVRLKLVKVLPVVLRATVVAAVGAVLATVAEPVVLMAKFVLVAVAMGFPELPIFPEIA